MSNLETDTQIFTRREMINAFSTGYLNGVMETVIVDDNKNLKMGKAYALLYLEELAELYERNS